MWSCSYYKIQACLIPTMGFKVRIILAAQILTSEESTFGTVPHLLPAITLAEVQGC